MGRLAPFVGSVERDADYHEGLDDDEDLLRYCWPGLVYLVHLGSQVYLVDGRGQRSLFYHFLGLLLDDAHLLDFFHFYFAK